MNWHFSRWAAVTAAAALSLVSVLPQSAAAQTASDGNATCTFDVGFADFLQSVSPDLVGSCLGPPHSNPNGNIEQATTTGLLYRRTCDGTGEFTDGANTWLNGPLGAGIRASDGAPFEWEPVTPCSATNTQVAPSAPIAPAPAPSIPTRSAPTPPNEPSQPVCTSPIVTLRNADVSFSDRRAVNYSCADLYHAKLIGTDFSAATLAGANLEAADLTGANFSNGSHLSFAVLVMVKATSSKQAAGPTFNGADLRRANVTSAKLQYSDFRYADLSNADLSRAVLTGSDFRGADLRATDLSQADFTDANLSGAYLCGANTTGTIFVRAIGVSKECN
jgi:hypothetical protein